MENINDTECIGPAALIHFKFKLGGPSLEEMFKMGSLTVFFSLQDHTNELSGE